MDHAYPSIRYESYRARNTWVQRFMLNWRSSRAFIVTREAAGNEDTAEIIIGPHLDRKALRRHISGPNSRDVFQPQKWNHVFNLKQTAGQNTSPKREPEIVNVAHIYFNISTQNVEAMAWAVAVNSSNPWAIIFCNLTRRKGRI